jgi:hypothetical protein
MKDGRVTVWDNSPTSHLTGSTTNTGPTVDLQGGFSLDGGTSYGTGPTGQGVEIIQTFVSGTQTTVWEFETSADASTWRKGGFIGAVALTTAGSAILKAAVPTQHRYFRLLATNTGTGASTSVAYAENVGSVIGTMDVYEGALTN